MEYGLADMNKNLSQVLQEMRINVIDVYKRQILKSTWQYIDGNWYYFGNTGIMESNGSATIENKRYYFYSDGIMAANG